MSRELHRYDLATLKNSKGGFLLESEEDDPRRRREREMREALKQKRLENAAKQGQVKEQSEWRLVGRLITCVRAS